MSIDPLFLLPLSGIILTRCICAAGHLGWNKWDGPKWRLVGLALSFMLLAGGSLGVALGQEWCPPILLAGVAGMVLFDRRKGYMR